MNETQVPAISPLCQSSKCPPNSPKAPKTLYIDLMNETQTSLTSPVTGRVYTADLERKTRRAFREYMNPASAYEREYFQVNVYADGEYVNFGFVDDASDVAGIEKAIREVMNWKEAPLETFAGMHSRFD